MKSKSEKNSTCRVLQVQGRRHQGTDREGGEGLRGLEEEKKEQNKGAVQEPNAFLERHLLKSTYALFKYLQDNNLCESVGFKDLGAGGVACASVELAETSGYGSEVWLDRVHTGMENLHPSVYLCSETQERFMWVSPPSLTEKILSHYNIKYDLPTVSSGAKASVVGKIRNNKKYVVRLGDDIPEHLVSRSNELIVSKAASNAGISPQVIYHDKGILILNYIELYLVEMWSLCVEVAPFLLLGMVFSGLISIFVDSRLIMKHIGQKNFSSIFKSIESSSKQDRILINFTVSGKHITVS